MQKNDQQHESFFSPEDEQSDLSEIATRWTDLWQDYMTAMATDPSLADQMRRMAEAYWSSLQGGEQHGGGSKQTHGTPAVSPLHGGGNDDLVKLHSRIISLETRLSTLEAAAGKTRGSPVRKKTGRSHHRKTKA